MLPRRIAAAATAAFIAAPAAANAAPIIRHASHGPSAAPLLVELGAVALTVVVFAVRKPLARFARAMVPRRHPAKTAHLSER
jgi:hypothetical protein